MTSEGHWDSLSKGLASLLLADVPPSGTEQWASALGTPPFLDPPLAETLSFPTRAGACVPGPGDKHPVALVTPAGILSLTNSSAVPTTEQN